MVLSGSRINDRGYIKVSGVEAVIKRSELIVSYGLTFTLNHILLGQYGVAAAT